MCIYCALVKTGIKVTDYRAVLILFTTSDNLAGSDQSSLGCDSQRLSEGGRGARLKELTRFRSHLVEVLR
jgi:hypothetical protein